MEEFVYDLESLGWSQSFQTAFERYSLDMCSPGRIAENNGASYQVYSQHGLVAGVISGRLRHEATSPADLPAVGDWVAIAQRTVLGPAVIHGVLPRKSKFGRKSAGRGAEEQVIAANVDIIFLVSSLNQEFNLRRLERYLVLAIDSGAMPVILLNKSDLCPDHAELARGVQDVADGIPVHAISVTDGAGLQPLDDYLIKGKTIALLGSSGVGKSSLINFLAGREMQSVGPIRMDDDRGRHTTTRRQMFVLPSGALVIDTPGLRELQMLDSPVGMAGAFEDVESIAAGCRFRDCRHQTEPDCAVRDAMERERLNPERFLAYEKLGKEMRHAALKTDKRAQADQKKRWKKLCRQASDKARDRWR